MRRVPVAALLSLLVLAGADARGATLFTHSGSVNPTTEGWTLSAGAAVPVGAVAGPPAAWSVNDNSSSTGGYAYYIATPDAGQLSAAATLGWRLSARVRTNDNGAATTSSRIVEFLNGSTRWSMLFGAEADNDPIVRLATSLNTGNPVDSWWGGPTYTLQGTGGGFHLYELVYDAAAGSADLFVDGVERISDHTGLADGTSGTVWWGSISTAPQGQADYALVRFSTTTADPSVPEPGTAAAALGLVVAALTAHRRRR